MEIKLRDYQEDAVNAALEGFDDGVPSGIESIPTGGGKTFCAAEIVRRLDRPALFLVHRDELATQAKDSFNVVTPGKTVGIVKAEKNEHGRDITIASVQTLMNEKRLAETMHHMGPNPIVIADEAHHWVAPAWEKVIRAIAPDSLLGLTATSHRADKRALGTLFDKIFYHVPMLELIARGYLAKPIGVRVESHVNLDLVETNNQTGDFVQKQLATVIDTPENNALVIQAYLDHCYGKRKHTLFFCQNVQHSQNIIAGLNDLHMPGVVAAGVFGITPIYERTFLYEWFASGKIPALVSVDVTTEGWDEPRVDAVMLCAPTKSLTRFIQRVGRGLRIFPTKENCLVVDIVYDTDRHSLITLPTLAGIRHDGSRLAGANESARKTGEEFDLLNLAIDLDPALGAIADPSVVSDRITTDVDLLMAKSKYNWNEVDKYWVAPGHDGMYLVLKYVHGEVTGWQPFVLHAPPATYPYIDPLFDRPIADISLAMAYAESKFPLPYLSRRDGTWRLNNLPPSPKQLSAALAWGIQKPEQYTKSQLSDRMGAAIVLSALRKVKW